MRLSSLFKPLLLIGAATIALFSSPAESKSITYPIIKDVSGKYPLCTTCVSFAEQNINNLLNIILNSGVIGSCGALCSKLPNSAEQTICSLLCDVVGVEAFIHLIDHVDLDPIWFCEEIKICPVQDCTTQQCVTINSLASQPSQGPSGQTFNIQLAYTVINNTGTGEIDFEIIDPSGQAFGDGVVIPGYFQGSYGINLQVNTQPTEDEPFSPGTYTVVVYICEGECGSKLSHSRVLSTQQTSFEITSSKAKISKVYNRMQVVQEMESFIQGLASIFAEQLHWESCIKDVYSLYTTIRSFEADVSSMRWGAWATDVRDLKSALGAVKDLCEEIKSTISDCDLTELGGKLGKVIAKLSNWIGEVEEGVDVAIHIINLVQDAIDVVEGIDHDNWYEVGQGVGGLVNTLA